MAKNENDLEFRARQQEWFSTLVPPIEKQVQADDSILSTASLGIMVWLHILDRYMNLHEMGMPGIAIRYEDLKTVPHTTLRRIFEYCGLSTVKMSEVYKVLEKDSQAGTELARDAVTQNKYVLKDFHLADLRRLLENHPVIQTSDFIVPTTWMP